MYKVYCIRMKHFWIAHYGTEKWRWSIYMGHISDFHYIEKLHELAAIVVKISRTSTSQIDKYTKSFNMEVFLCWIWVTFMTIGFLKAGHKKSMELIVWPGGFVRKVRKIFYRVRSSAGSSASAFSISNRVLMCLGFIHSRLNHSV